MLKGLIAIMCVVFGLEAAVTLAGNNPLLPEQKKNITCGKIVSASLCKKIGQMLLVGFGGVRQTEQGVPYWTSGTQLTPSSPVVSAIVKGNVAGVILFSRLHYDRDAQVYLPRNVESPLQLKSLTQALQCYALSYQKHPLFITLDEEGGLVSRLSPDRGFKAASYVPSQLGEAQKLANTLARSKSPEQQQRAKYINGIITQQFNRVAQTLSENNINFNLAPVVDVNVNPVNPIIGLWGRSYSSDPKIVAQLAEKFINALHAKGIVVALKHFPGHGSSTRDSHLGLVDVTKTYQKTVELYPYHYLLAKPNLVDAVMSTHVINGQIDRTQCKKGASNDPRTWCPATLSSKTLTGVLRKKLHFKGLIISDDMTMGAITNEYPLAEALKRSINAGVNLLILNNGKQDQTDLVIDTIAQLVKQGEISEETIDQSYQKIIQFKERHFSSYSTERYCDHLYGIRARTSS